MAAWTAVFTGCAIFGALLAAHSNPFPPGVDQAGLSPISPAPGSPSASASPVPKPDRWHGTMRTYSYHQLYVGGRCTTRWRGLLAFTVDDRGKVHGTGTVHLVGGLRCDSPNAQVNAERLMLDLSGVESGGALHLRLAETGTDPTNASDYGGLVGTLSALRIALPVKHGVATGKLTAHLLDEEGRGTYYSSSAFLISCANCSNG